MTRKASGPGAPHGPAGQPYLVEVHILGLPLAIWARAEEHADGLLRELTLVAASDARDPAYHAPRHLLALVQELETDYASMTSEQRTRILAAADAGAAAIDLVYEVPPDVAVACRRLEAAMDAADRFCSDGKYLLSLATPPDALAFRQWYLGEFVRQIEGEPPQSWPDWAVARGLTPTHPPGPRHGR